MRSIPKIVGIGNTLWAKVCTNARGLELQAFEEE